MATLPVLGRCVGALCITIVGPFVFLLYVVAAVESVHPRARGWEDSFEPPAQARGEDVSLAWIEGEQFPHPGAPWLAPSEWDL